MTEDGELELMDLSVEYGRKLAPCGCDSAPACQVCIGTGVEPHMLRTLYALACEASDLTLDENEDIASWVCSRKLVAAVYGAN